MNFLHISDLHIGKRLLGKPLMEDQRHILDEIINMAARPEIDALLIAGDLYDKAQPTGEAIEMVSGFLSALSRLKKPVFVVSGNHDSPEQVAYCADLLRSAHLYVSPAFAGAPERHVLEDAYGPVHVYLLPFVRPAQVRRAFPDRAAQIKGYADALRVAVEEMHIDPTARNVLVAHQFVIGADGELSLSDSEERMVGGVDAVPADIFRDFDYVALGHLHTPQRVGSDRVRYAGSPLKYSLSEEKQNKAALMVCLGEKGADIQMEKWPYHPLRDVKSLRGTLAELTAEGKLDRDYVFVTITDELPPLDPMGSLLLSYPNYVQYRMENSRSGEKMEVIADRVEEKDPLEHFQEFFFYQNNGQEPSAHQMELMRKIIQELEEESGASH